MFTCPRGVTIRPKYACPKGRTGVVQAKAPAHLLEGSWPTEALLAQIAVSKHSEHMPLNRQAVVMARHGVPIDRSVLADWMGRTGALIAPVVDHMDAFFIWLAAQAARVSRKSELGEAMAYMLRREEGFRIFLNNGRVDIGSNLVENAIRSPAMNRRNALFAGNDEGGRNWARFASLIGSCKMNGVEPYAYLKDLFTKLANGHLDKDIDALMPWAYGQRADG